jgi:hypothetical protein
LTSNDCVKTDTPWAQHLKLRPQSAEAVEKSEANGTIQLQSLRRAAEALDCTAKFDPSRQVGPPPSAPDRTVYLAAPLESPDAADDPKMIRKRPNEP